MGDTKLTSLLSVEEALERLLKVFSPVDTLQAPLSQAADRVLAEAIRAPFDFPLFNNSSMDGFAVQASDVVDASVDRPVSLAVVADIPAGQAPAVNLFPGEAMRIMTGAALPPGADAVVPVEQTDFPGGVPGIGLPPRVKIYKSVVPGDSVRPRGQDVCAGQFVLEPGIRLRPQDVGFLAMLGIAQVPVYRKPRIAILSTGDELVPVESPLGPGQIHESNAYTLAAQINHYGGESVSLGITPDRFEAVKSSLDRAVAEGVDLILSTAGVSVGAFDFVRVVVEQHGQLDFWRVNMRPGKPIAFGGYRGVPFIGLPGNPVSAFVGCEVFVRPALLKMAGLANTGRPTQRVRIQEAIESDGRESYLRAVITFDGKHWLARLTGHQGSGNLRSLVQANAFILVPSEVKSLPPGSELDAWLFGD